MNEEMCVEKMPITDEYLERWTHIGELPIT